MTTPKIQTRSGTAPISYDEAEGTVEIVIATATRAEREGYLEELVISEDAIDASRLTAGAVNMILDHKAEGLPIGRVIGYRIENDELIATVKLSESKANEDVVTDIRSGVIRTVSIGYHILEIQELEENGIPVIRVTRWRPAEISIVTIPADPLAQIRSSATALTRRTTTAAAQPTKKGQRMEDDDLQNEDQIDTVETEEELEDEERVEDGDIETAEDDNDEDVTAEGDEDDPAEGTRSAQILQLCKRHGLSMDFAIRHVSSGATVDAVRTAILDKLAERSPMPINTTRARVTRDAQETLVARAADALYSRLTGTEPSARGRELRNLSTIELAREFVGSGARSMSRPEVIDRALQTRSGMHTTSDFAAALGTAANRTLRAAYDAAELTYGPFIRETTVPDFRATERVQIGDAPMLKERKQGSETSYGTLSDAKEAIQLATFARALKMTRQMMINDDLGAFARILTSFGLRAGELKSDLVYNVLTANPKMGDGKQLFSSAHNNLLNAELSVDGLSAVRKSMRTQKSRDGASLNLVAKTLIVGPELETRAQQLIAPIAAAVSGEVNPFSGGSLQLVVDARIEDDSWFVAANPGLIDTIELAFLDGAKGLQTRTIEEPMLDGMSVLAQIDVEAAAIDHLGLVKSKAA
jgi:HK97 family phage prohead protease